MKTPKGRSIDNDRRLADIDENGHIVVRAWRTKDGRIVDIKKMDDEHLKNTIRFLERRGVRSEKEQETDLIARTEAAMCQMGELAQAQYEAMLKEKEHREKVSAGQHHDQAIPGDARNQ